MAESDAHTPLLHHHHHHHHSLHPRFLPNSLHPPTNMPLIWTGKAREKKGRPPSSHPTRPLVCNKAVCATPVINPPPQKRRSTRGARPATGRALIGARRRTRRRGAPQPRSIIDVCAQLQASRHQQSVAQARLKDSWILNRRCIKIKDHSFPLTAHQPPPSSPLSLHPPPPHPHYISLSFLNFDICPVRVDVCVCVCV